MNIITYDFCLYFFRILFNDFYRTGVWAIINLSFHSISFDVNVTHSFLLFRISFINLTISFLLYHIATYLATSLGFAPNTAQHAECQAVVASLYDVFIKKECTLLEINPLVETASGTVSPADCLDTNCYFIIYHLLYQTLSLLYLICYLNCWYQNPL